MWYGYALVGTRTEPLASQIERIEAAGVHPDNITHDVRPNGGYVPARTELLRRIEPGDAVIVSSPAWVGYNFTDRRGVLDAIVSAGAELRVLDEPPIDAANPAAVQTFLKRSAREHRAWVARHIKGGGRKAKKRLTGKDAEIVRAMWHDLNFTVNEVLVQCARRGATELNKHNLRQDWGPRRREGSEAAE